VRRIGVQDGDRRVERDLEPFLAASGTTAFLIVRGETLLYEGYFNGYDHDSVQTSMSVAKSVLGALVGIAVGEGRIGSVDDPITRYVPELAERDPRFGQITLRHLLTMRSGLRYEEGGGPWGDDTATYYAPDLRALALEGTEVVDAPGRRFHYNNFNPLLVGLTLERAVGMPVASYLEARLWRPLGMEADDLVLVRFGRDDGYRHWPDLLGDLARRLDEPAPAPTS
jgi:CubicO group peptidase (beta-lactamase class C family)